MHRLGFGDSKYVNEVKLMEDDANGKLLKSMHYKDKWMEDIDYIIILSPDPKVN